MATRLTPQFPPVPPKAIASYSYTDIEDGTGNVDYYALVSEQDTALTYSLISQTYPSLTIETALANAATLTFETGTFNVPRFIKGTAYAVVPICYPGGAGNGSVNLKLQHWDGTTATDMTASIATFDDPSGGSKFEQTFTKMPITTEKLVKKGDSIRLLVTAASGGSAVTVAHSPTNQTGTYTGNTQLILGVPFRLKDIS